MPFCLKCEKLFNSAHLLRDHISHSSCMPQTSDSHALFMHIHNDFLCATCGTVTESEDAFTMHISEHNLEEIFW